MFAAELLQHLMVGRWWMETATAAEVRFGDQAAQFATELPPEIVQFLTIPGQIDGAGIKSCIHDLFHRKADKLDARIAFRIFFRAGHGIGESFFAMKSITRRDDHVSRSIKGKTCPKGFMNRFRPGGRPDDAFQTSASLRTVKIGQQPFDRQRFDFGDSVVGRHRHGRNVFIRSRG